MYIRKNRFQNPIILQVGLIVVLIVVPIVSAQAATVGYVQGTITKVHAGKDGWFGVRFYLDKTSDTTNGQCNSLFVYTEPDVNSGHNSKVAVFTAAYLAGKSVTFSVEIGRENYCKIFEGSMY